ncbi:MAG: YicC family protein [Acidobacteriota bacterium]|nr:YicC family protein [Acidobacteriota bacterium]
MIHSMTGYGRGQWQDGSWLCRVEVKSVNHRYLDIQSRLPSELSSLDGKIRKWIQKRIRRGRVDLSLKIERGDGPGFSLNRPLFEGYLDALKLLERDYSIGGNVEPGQLLRMPGMLARESAPISDEQLAVLEVGVASAVAQALSDLETMRSAEGQVLVAEIRRRLDAIQTEVRTIETQSEGLLELHRERLRTRMETILAEVDIDPARLLQEAAHQADRGDIREEVSRLISHGAQCRALLSGSREVGKKIDFMMQEMNREANTILSKNAGLADRRLDITNAAITIKTEVEKIREQIQNVE